MGRLVLLNGAPGSGKSTLAQLLAQDQPLAMALDIDAVKHSLGQWRTALPASGVAARRLAIAMASEHLRHGHDVLVAQFLAREDFIIELERLTVDLGVTWFEFVLAVDEEELRTRLLVRAESPQLPEHVVNNDLVSADDAGQLVRSIDSVIALRPTAIVVDANGTVEETAEIMRGHLVDPIAQHHR